jgi:hypothetical protein
MRRQRRRRGSLSARRWAKPPPSPPTRKRRRTRVCWSAEADAEQRDEAAPGGRHASGHWRGPVVQRHGWWRAPKKVLFYGFLI